MKKDEIVTIKGIDVLISRIAGWRKRTEGHEYYIDVYLDSGKPIEILVSDSEDKYGLIEEQIKIIIATLKLSTGVKLDENGE